MQTERNSRTAFTLVELLIATAITALIVVLLGTMFNSLTATSLRANQRIDAFRDARAALQMIQRDLSGLVRNQRDATGAAVTLPAAYFVLKDLYDDPSPGNQQIYALVAAKNSGPGDLCAVGYYCRWDSQKNAYSLYRFFTSSNTTYSTIAAALPAGYVRDTALYTPDPNNTIPTALHDEVLASYVWNLKIVSYDVSGNPLPSPAYPLVSDSSATTVDPLPAAIEISFLTISPNSARALIATGAQSGVWMDSTNPIYQHLIAPNAYQFRTRIKL